ncbi:MAG: hypothetical protein R2729_02010 [Bryobacteraceae bacterium]
MTTGSLIPTLAAACMLMAPALGAAERCAMNTGSESQAWNSGRKASRLMEDVRRDARTIQDHAATLATFEDNSGVHWQSHAAQLRDMKSAVNRMSENLGQLEAIKSSLPAWQREAIDGAVKTQHMLATETTASIEMVNAQRDDLWTPQYHNTVKALYTNSSDLQARIGHVQALVKARREERKLETEVNAGM